LLEGLRTTSGTQAGWSAANVSEIDIVLQAWNILEVKNMKLSRNNELLMNLLEYKACFYFRKFSRLSENKKLGMFRSTPFYYIYDLNFIQLNQALHLCQVLVLRGYKSQGNSHVFN
jgi:hypothetical protein